MKTLVRKSIKVNKKQSKEVWEQMTPVLEKRLGKIDADIKAGRNLSPAFASMKEMNAYLSAL